jgi:hypothetical protein
MKVEDSRMGPVGMRGLFGGGRGPLLNDPSDDLVGEAARGEDAFRSWLEEADDAFVVGDDEEGNVGDSEAREDVVGDNEGWRAAKEFGWGLWWGLRWVGGSG